MPVTLRKRLQCHYCGKRLNTARRDGSKIKCDGCLADNFFDSDDNFTDVPVEEVRRAGGHAPLAEVASESDIFCTTCLKNQYLYTAALSEYLPDEDDPNYEAIDNALPEYQKQLDLRYPRCCRQCEPRVQAQLKRANYAAKSDHLQRKMQRDRNMRTTPAQYLRSWLIAAAGLGSLTSLLVQLFWHLLTSQANTDLIVAGITPRQCLYQYPIPSQCTEYAATWMPYSLTAGLLCFWWNPKWQHRLEGREGRLIGLSRYYKLQTILLGLRFAAWALLRDLPGIEEHAAPIHTMVFLVLLATSLYLYFGVVKVDKTPIVDWNQTQAPLVDPNQYEAPESQQQPSIASSQSKRVLPVEALASTPRSLPYETWQPPTPPLEDDSMDWAPAGQTFNPRPRIPKPRVEEKSPFYGTLPAKPVRGSLNPKIQSAPVQRPAIGLPPGFFGLSKSRDQKDDDSMRTPVKEVFAAPKFFANERQSDTGLEALFDTVFSVRDTTHNKSSSSHTVARRGTGPSLFDLPGKVNTNSANTISTQYNRSPPVWGMLISCAIIIGLVVLATSLIPDASDTDRVGSPSTILPYLALVPVFHGLSDLVCQGQIAGSTLISGTFELALTIATYAVAPKLSLTYVPLWNKFVVGTVCLFFLREVYRLFQLQNSPTSMPMAVKQHMSQSIRRVEHNDIEAEDSESTPIAPIHALPTPYEAPPPVSPQRRTPFNASYTSLRNRDSDESISTTASAHTTSTASGWKTPQNPGRTVDWQSHRGTPSESGLISRGLGGLTLSNDFGIGSGITRPRDRPTPGQSGPFNRHR